MKSTVRQFERINNWVVRPPKIPKQHKFIGLDMYGRILVIKYNFNRFTYKGANNEQILSIS